MIDAVATDVAVVAAMGSGTVRGPDAVFPIGALTYAVSSEGRGVLFLKAGTGDVKHDRS